MTSDRLPYYQFVKQELTTGSSVPSTDSTPVERPGPTPTEIVEHIMEKKMRPTIPVLDDDVEDQLDFDSIWADKLRTKYGIRNAID